MRLLLVFLVALALAGCKDEGGTRPPVCQRTIDLSLSDRGTTDAWLRVRFTEAPPYSFRLIRDGEPVLTVVASSSDTLVADEPLLPNRSYTHKAYRLSGTNVIDSSQPVQVTTLDTTSSAWQWALDTLGVMNSYLLDCAIIAPDNIWVVGTIYVRDSLGNVEDTPHNAAMWDGMQWNLLRIQFYTICGQQSRTPYPTSSVFAFSPNDVWIAMDGDQVTRWNGNTQTATMCLPFSFSVRELWGTSPNAMYAAGSGGNIAFYNGSTWQRQESGTTLALTDVFGVNANEVYVVGLHRGQVWGVVLQNMGTVWETMIEGEILTDTSQLFRTKLYGTTEGLWVDERGALYTVGNFMYQFKHGKWGYVKSLPENFIGGSNFVRGYLKDVQGNASNDMFIVGERNTIRHYNGSSWQQTGLPYSYTSPISWYRVAVIGNNAVAVGSIPESFGRGLVMRLWR